MRRPDFITGIVVSTAMPLAARAQQQQPGPMRRIGVLILFRHELLMQVADVGDDFTGRFDFVLDVR
jgi:hypothetical protein